ncbi:hypothetical protein [Streptomyces glaucescens]|nr:hypothetical protein [Streptomyces glaucescens]
MSESSRPAPASVRLSRTGAWTLVPRSYTFATARSSRSLTAQRTLTIG